MTLSATRLANPAGPSCSASYTVAIPPCAMRRTSRNVLVYSSRWSGGGMLVAGSWWLVAGIGLRLLTHDRRNSRHHDHWRRADGAVRCVLRRNARGEFAYRRCSSGTGRPTRGAVSREVHLRRRRLPEVSGQGAGARTRRADGAILAGG